ncbi:zinc ribbon domain-containing protein [Natronocalculus amylovorans]|uniref:Zinc ribbon domain-containing protein n=1 Tax=Natronocalculus amylovorans TaxID=2917812 RepID=A0AAE3FZ23_9EURY|nr:zinc ribbon domain-containing protein [Natronocalculus amylovorans]MCL9817936.1 zinc ribbon domain-containing protein [Natronocalculus amylovorans]NUE03130.1 zinc ribbon domain-containing protein [Halorubraceae archaeon YAN]
MSGPRKRCTNCGTDIPHAAKICQECKTVQPSNLLLVGVVVFGLFCLLFGVPIALFSVGLGRLIGALFAVCGLAMVFGGYTAYIDRKAGIEV